MVSKPDEDVQQTETRLIWHTGSGKAGNAVVPTDVAIEESVELADEIYNRVFRKVSERIAQK